MPSNEKQWILLEDAFDPARLYHKETIFTIGNGYLSTRGSFEEGYPGERAATFVHGVFDDIAIAETELANIPNWTSLEISLAGERFSLKRGEIIQFQRSLDFRTGVLTRDIHWRSPSGRTAALRFERFTNFADPHVACVRVSITPLDFSGEVRIQAGLNGGVDTYGTVHWNWIDQWVSHSESWLHISTISSGIDLGMAMRLWTDSGEPVQQIGWDVKNHPTLAATFHVSPGQTAAAEKLVTIYTSRETSHPADQAWRELQAIDSPGWTPLLEASTSAWRREWEDCDLVVEGDEEVQLAVRFNLFQLLIAAPRQDERISIGAKTLSGFGYRGHVFWDTEIFMLPFFTFTRPAIARNLLSYRWHNLPGARRKARANNYKGAQYPWESATSGDEVTPVWVPHPEERAKLVRIWTGDIEIHVSADIAYAVYQYWQVTGDDRFLLERGLEIILETARFWASRAEWNDQNARYEFTDVIGPDEYHDHVDNNAFTNYMVRWHLITALGLLTWVETAYPGAASELIERLELAGEEREEWKRVADRIYLPYHPHTRLIEQFDGYLVREDVDLEAYKERKHSMQFLLGIEGVNETQVLKQPDVLMLLYLLPEWFDQKTLKVNYDYYNARTDHTYGSSLGPAIHAIMACRVGKVNEAYEHLRRAAFTDLYDVRGNAEDGIHGASAGGVWQALVFGFAGLTLSSDGWTTNPRLPGHWRRLAFKFYYRGEQHQVEVRNNE